VNVVVLSDTHMPGRARRLPDPLVADLERADLIVHAGDFATVEVLAMLRGFAPVQAVHGNVDEPDLRRMLPRRLRVQVEGRWLGVVHGDSPRLPTVQRAAAEFVDEGVDVIVFGHSHKPLLRREGDVLLFNPGSPTDRRAEPRFSYGRLTIGPDGRLAAEHVWLDPDDLANRAGA
jgi:putative phosphoesterase